MENLVIVESPAKASKIEKILGAGYKVVSSYGHIRDLKKRTFSVDPNTFDPQYEVPKDKSKVVEQLKKAARDASTVWLASDEDREGEAISWHLSEVLGLKQEQIKRIVFHEITPPAILEAIKHPRSIDLNLVNAQQARRVLDRIVGFKLSPVLWRKVKPSLSAGRVQSVAVRLIVEREREIQRFQGEDTFRVTAIFANSGGAEIRAELGRRFRTAADAQAFLESCKDAQFGVEDVVTKPQKRTPAAPFTTSTLQQEAAHKLGFTVAQTMMIAQHLYENGLITYMRTDSVNLSNLCLAASRNLIASKMGEQYVKTRQYTTKSKGAQEAHEAIRPTYMETSEIEGTPQEKRLYELIWKHTLASQMADAVIEKTTVAISVSGTQETFVASGEVVTFDGFLKIYRENKEEDGAPVEEHIPLLPEIRVGETLLRKQVVATQRPAQHPARYNEAALVRKLEELGIGRPSTYSATITTIQQRQYVEKGDKPGVERSFTSFILSGPEIVTEERQQAVGAERNRLMPTDIGLVVNDFLMENFPAIMDYDFTADVEKQFDLIAEGGAEWKDMLREFSAGFDPQVETVLANHSARKAGERILGEEPGTGQPVMVKIGRFGPVAQIGSADATEKPRFAQLKVGQSLETITLEEALELFKFPRQMGKYEGIPVAVGVGKFGPYVSHGGTYVSIPEDMDPNTITFQESVILLHHHYQAEKERHLKQFEEDPEMEVLTGRYGPYVCYRGLNYRLPKNLHDRARELSYEECMKVVNARPKRRYTRKK